MPRPGIVRGITGPGDQAGVVHRAPAATRVAPAALPPYLFVATAPWSALWPVAMVVF